MKLGSGPTVLQNICFHQTHKKNPWRVLCVLLMLSRIHRKGISQPPICPRIVGLMAGTGGLIDLMAR
jgi:hypothetical protein